MDTLLSSSAVKNMELKTKIRANELLSRFYQYADQIQVLSLDCFDTLIWRRTAEPYDVFYDLEKNPLYKKLGLSARLRIEGEQLAQQTMRVRKGCGQAKLKDIYQITHPALFPEQIEALVEAELTAEIEVCYVFHPVIELIRAAYAKQKKIIIVSDSYFDEKQLRRLLESKLPADVMSYIAHIYCSCDQGQSKVEGLFQHVINHLNVPAQSIFHVGDNLIADYSGAIKSGLHAANFIHHNDHVAEILRMYAIAASYVDSSIRNTRGLANPFKGFIASKLINDTPASIIGYATLGPIMYAFARYVIDEVEQVRRMGKNAKVIFLMRDAFLPAQACELIFGSAVGKLATISRFSAFAASFRNATDVEEYLAANATSLRFQDMCSQLLLPDDLAKSIIHKVESAQYSVNEFVTLIQTEQVLKIIIKNSDQYRNRLLSYLKKQVNFEPGDTLMFVDLGYACSTQIRLEPVLREQGLDIIGRYLIVTPKPGWELSRAGLLDPSVLDEKALTMLIHYIPIFEKLCCSTDKSVMDFDNDGNPIYSDVDVSQQQHTIIQLIQSEALQFICDVEKFIEQSHIRIDKQMLRDIAAFNLTRLIYFPTKIELDYLQSFHLDVNLGTKEVISIFDLNKGLTSLRRRGWLHSAKENIKNMRLNYPAEWRSANLELSLALIAQIRFGFDLSLNDLSQRREQLQVLYTIQANNTTLKTLEARPTHDGYYSMLVPVIVGHIGICFGLNYRWVEIDSAEMINVAYLFSRNEFENTVDMSSHLMVDQMIDRGGGLFECVSDAGLLVFATPVNLDNNNYVLRVVFRPIVKEEREEQSQG